MGLQEKKQRHMYETEIVPEATEEMKSITGVDVTVDIDWDTFGDSNAIAELQHQALGRIVEALRDLCRDDFAKEAVQEGFKRVFITNLESLDDRKVEMVDGSLTLQTVWADYYNHFSSGDIRQAIEAGL